MDRIHELLPSDNLSPETLALLSRRGVREALQALGLRASRRLGQNFLVEPAVLAHILGAAALGSQDAVLEVGSGLGVLTTELLRRAGKDQVVVTGVLTHMCCETTARSAFCRGFEVYLPADALASSDEAHHTASLLNLADAVAVVLSTRELLEAAG